jgi:hypothetical protein
MMLRERLYGSVLLTLVSVPGFLIGQKLRAGEPQVALALVPISLLVVFVASAIMRPNGRVD